ncbi:MAG: hypothetical protein ACR2LR_09545 [Hassallia sp.]
MHPITRRLIMALMKTSDRLEVEPNQLNLFSNFTLQPVIRPNTLMMSADALVQWKSQIFDYQQRLRESQPPQQTTLFDVAPSHCDLDQIDPLTLQLRSLSFTECQQTVQGKLVYIL